MFCNLAPFFAGVTFALACLKGVELAGLVVWFSPVGLIACAMAIVIAWRKGEKLSQKLASTLLNGLALVLFGYHSLIILFLLTVGFPSPN